MAVSGWARRDWARFAPASCALVWSGAASRGSGKPRHATVGSGQARSGKAWAGKAGRVTAGRGLAWSAREWPAEVGLGEPGRGRGPARPRRGLPRRGKVRIATVGHAMQWFAWARSGEPRLGS